MTEQEKWFDALTKDRAESADMLEKPSMRGIQRSVVDKYSDQAHFIYELLQNADDVKATSTHFRLEREGLSSPTMALFDLPFRIPRMKNQIRTTALWDMSTPLLPLPIPTKQNLPSASSVLGSKRSFNIHRRRTSTTQQFGSRLNASLCRTSWMPTLRGGNHQKRHFYFHLTTRQNDLKKAMTKFLRS